MKKRIFIITHNLGLGGVQRKIVDIANYMGQEKPKVDVYVLLRKKSKFSLSRNIKNRRARKVYYLDWLPIRIPFFFPVFVFYLTFRLRPEAILTFSDASSLSAIWAKILLFWRKIRVVVSEDRYVPKEVSTYKFAPLRRFLRRFFYRRADTIFTPNKEMAKDLAKACGLSFSRVVVVTNWTNLVKEKIKNRVKEYDLIYVGRLVDIKNVRFLVKAVQKLKKHKSNISLCLVGEGDDQNYLKSLVKKNGLEENVFFVGPKHDIRSYLIKSRIFVMPSKAEGLPLTILEAMALGLPVVSSNYKGSKEVIKEGINGFLYTDLKEFENRIKLLLENPSFCSKIGRQAREYVKKYHSEENINQYFEALSLNN